MNDRAVNFNFCPLGGCASPDSLSLGLVRLAPAPWGGRWSLGGGMLQGSSQPWKYAFCYYDTNWTSYSVEATVQFPVGAFGGGIGGRLNASSGAHYAAWIYPEGSAGGSNILAVIKFSAARF